MAKTLLKGKLIAVTIAVLAAATGAFLLADTTDYAAAAETTDGTAAEDIIADEVNPEDPENPGEEPVIEKLPAPTHVKLRKEKMGLAKKTCFLRGSWDPVEGAKGYEYQYKGRNDAQGAVDWAAAIARDNRFTYGKKPETSKAGCFFCGTTSWTKPAGYERTYVCCTFITAAFAHGANDPVILDICQRCRTLGGTAASTHPDNFTKTGVFKEVHPSYRTLKPGDVFLYTRGEVNHVSMYAGHGQYVEATSAYGPWTTASIGVRTLTESKFKYLSNSGVVRYIGDKKKAWDLTTKKTMSRGIPHKVGKKAKFRVRAYTKVKGERVYGEWSEWKTKWD